MDVTEENVSTGEMLEKIAELHYSRSQLKNLNADMRQLLDAADEELMMLRSDNANLRKQTKALEKIISDTQPTESEPSKLLLYENSSLKTSNEKQLQKLEKESTMMKEQNKEFAAQIKSLLEQREHDKINLNKFSVELQTLEVGMDEAQLELQQMNEVILKKNLQIKQAEATVEECSTIIKSKLALYRNFVECTDTCSGSRLFLTPKIKDLRLSNQELRNQLDDRQSETSLALVSDMMGGKVGSQTPPLSFAEEIKLLASTAEVHSSTQTSVDLNHEGEFEAEEVLKPESLQVSLHDRSAVEVVIKTAVKIVFFLYVLTLTFVVFLACGGWTMNVITLSVNTLWSTAFIMLQPYCSMEYIALPPM